MSEVETQLREYFDAAVERVTAEDILAGHRVTEKVQFSRPRWHPRPAWAAIAAFAATVVVLGGSIGLGTWLRNPDEDAASGGFRGAVDTITGGSVPWWPIAVIVVAMAALVFVLTFMRRGIRKEKAMATTIDTPTSDKQLEDAQRNNHWLIGAVVVLAIALLALGAWVVYDQAQTADTAGSDAVIEMLDDYRAAWNEYDGDAFMALTAEDYVLVSSGGEEVARTMQASTIRGFAKGINFQVEQIGDPVVVGDGPYYVAVANRLDSDAYEGDLVDHVVISTFVVVETADGLKVAEHHTVGNT